MATDEETPLLVENTPSTPTLNHKRDVHILCWAFLLIFLAYGAAQNLESTINTEGDLGTISLGILYLSFTFFSVLASLVVRKLGSKNALVLGTTGYWLFIAANLKPTWYTMVPASVYLGFAASIIWVAQEGAFAQLKFWQSASIALVFFISSSISLQTMVIILLAALCVSVAVFLVSHA